VTSQREHGPRALAERGCGDVVGDYIEALAHEHVSARQHFQPAQQLLVLKFFVGEAHDCFERRLIAQPVIATDVQHLCTEESLDEDKHVGVGAALDLAQEAMLGWRQKRQLIGQREAVWQEERSIRWT
jgi:hypothetical protein